MKISCPTCAAKYSVADEKIQSRLAKIRCRKCSSTIVIDGTASPANVYIGEGPALVSGNPPADGAAAELASSSEAAPGSARFGGVGFTDPAPAASEPMGPAADEYAVDIADNDQRNMTIHQIVGAYNEGLITADTYIWKEGMADWQTLAEVREVATALHAAARAVGSSPVASPLAAASPGAMPAAVRRADHGAARDLFGGIDRAGGEDDITTSAPEATPSFTAGTGARNESSVLFSLSALTGTEASSASSGGKRRTSADDSGLIDLQALTAAEATAGGGAYAASPVGAFGASPLISAPLGGVSGPALGGGLGGSYGRSPGGKIGLIVGALALGLCIVAATAFVLKGGADQEPALALEPGRGTEEVAPAAQAIAEPGETSGKAAAADPAPSAPEEPAVVAAAEQEDKEPESAAPREQAATKTAARPRVSRPAPRPKSPAAAPDPEPAPKPAASRPEPAASSEPKPKPKKKEKACECKPADLLCAMRCSAQK